MIKGKWIHVDSQGIGWEAECYQVAPGTVRARQQTNYKQMPVVITNFSCPVCGGNSFEAIYQSPQLRRFTANTVIGPGPDAGQPRENWRRITDYCCPGCTTHFDDPAKFSKNKPADTVPPQPTPKPTHPIRAALSELRKGL